MTDNDKSSSMLIKFVTDLVEKIMGIILKEKQVMCTMACIVYDYDPLTLNATLYLPPDFVTISSVNYKNRTGVTIHPGEKVYLLYKYGDISQGWIANL